MYCTHCFCISTFNYSGTSASAAHFQAYLLEGMMRWNQDRQTAATTSDTGSSIYSGEMRHVANVLRMDVFGSMLFPDYQPPRKYNGMLNLFFQTNYILEYFVFKNTAVHEIYFLSCCFYLISFIINVYRKLTNIYIRF